MKATVKTAIILILLPWQAFGQLSFAPLIGYGYSNGKATINNLLLPTSKLGGIVAGGLAEYNITDNSHLQSGLLLSSDGFSLPNFLFTTQELKSYNILLPLTFQYRIGKERANKFIVGGGLYVAYNVYSTASSLYVESSTDSLAPYTPTIKPFSAGLSVNAGYELINGLFLRINYQHSLTNILENGKEFESLFIPFQASACVGYFIGRHKRK